MQRKKVYGDGLSKFILSAFIVMPQLLTNAQVLYAKSKKTSSTDTGVADVTSGIDTLVSLVKGCVVGVGVIFLAWGVLDFGTAYSAHDTTQQAQAVKKVIGGLIMVATPAILSLLGV